MRIKCRFRYLGLLLLGGSLITIPNTENAATAQQPIPIPLPQAMPTGQPGGIPNAAAPIGGGQPEVPPSKPVVVPKSTDMTAPFGPRVKTFPPPGGFVLPAEEGYPGGINTLKAVIPYISPAVLPEDRALPINLVTALRLAQAQAWDIGIASQQIRIAAAQLTQANVLWMPTIASGMDLQHHDGILQNIDGTTSKVNKNLLELGSGPEAVFSVSDAIFQPLQARQVEKARKADLQTQTNDITFNVAKAYFDVQQSRGFLAGTIDTLSRTRDLLRRIDAMAPDLVPAVEVARAQAELARIEQVEQSAREQWAVASAELVRIIRLDPAAVVVPIEPPHLQVTLVTPEQPLDNLLPVALAARPELISFQALTEAALKRWREEQFRPLLPSVYFRGGQGQLPDSMMFGGFVGGNNGAYGQMHPRADYELQVMWELRNLGFGNAAAMRERRAEYDVSRMQAYKIQDFVAREVAQAYFQVRSARARYLRAEVELQTADVSARQNFEGLGTVKRLGDIIIPVIRPQEAVVSMTALLNAYNDYFTTVGDYNRSQFQLYRALGNPAQLLPTLNQNMPEGSNCNPAPPGPASPAPPLKHGHGHAADGCDHPPAVVEVGSSTDPANPAAPNTQNTTAPNTQNPAAPNRPVAPTGASASPAAPATPITQVEAMSASLIVRVPASAEVYCDGVKMTLTGSDRSFLSPPLPQGRRFPYEIRACWTDSDGKAVEKRRRVEVQAGQRTTVDFLTRP